MSDSKSLSGRSLYLMLARDARNEIAADLEALETKPLSDYGAVFDRIHKNRERAHHWEFLAGLSDWRMNDDSAA